MYWVYILRSADSSYYTGHTDNLEKRIGQYQEGECAVNTTVMRTPLELVWWQVCATREEALLAERQIKSWCPRKKEAMMRGAWIEMNEEISRSAKVNPFTLREDFFAPIDYTQESLAEELRTNGFTFTRPS